jgi:ABC-type transport system involved in multi-copper enzyme maturation permease subunit
MTQAITETRRSRWLRRVTQNPIAVKELRSRMRGRRAMVTMTTYLFILSALISLVYLIYVTQVRQLYGPDPRQAGKSVFIALIAVEVFLVAFIGPAFTSSAISGERERQTYDLLRTTLLSSRALVSGKLISALSYVLLLLVTTIPLQGMAFLLGGVALVEIVVSQLVLVVAAVAFAMWGLFASTLVRTTLGTTVITFAGSLFSLIGLPMLALFVVPLWTGISLGFSSAVVELVATYAGLVAASFNLPAALIVSDLALVVENAVFIQRQTIGGYSVYLFSPWWPFLFIYTLGALLLYWWTVRRVRRVTAS